LLVSTGPSLYRRHRPRTFVDVVDQEHVFRTQCDAADERGVKAGAGAGLRAAQRLAPQPTRSVKPAPATPPPAEAAPVREGGPDSSATLGLDDATACWPAVVDLVRAENAILAALLTDARPIAVRDRELTLAFPGGAAYLKKKAEQEDYRRVAGEAVQAVTGQRLVLRYELRDGEAAVTRLARGLPLGADFECADEPTLGRALVGRRAV
jgi:hypothetical protein